MAKQKSENLYNIPLADLLEAGCHFGHQTRRWNPQMAPYIWQAREGIHIFDLSKTAFALAKACLALKELIASGGVVVFVGTKRQAQAIIKEEAEKIGIPYVANRWLGGTITNWEEMKKRIVKLIDMKDKKGKGEYSKYTKKENIMLEKEIERLQRAFGGIIDLKDLPQAIVVVDPKKEYAAVKEAVLKNIEVFALADSNCSPDDIDYLIPGNDDAIGSIKLIVSSLARAAGDGLELKRKATKSKK